MPPIVYFFIGGFMSIKLCCLHKGNARIYTKRLDIINEAIKEGYFVDVIKEKPYIYNRELISL